MKKFYALFSSLLFFITMAFAQIPSYIPSNGLVAWWPFNGNANDESGNGNNGTSSGAGLTVDRFGISNSAYSFNGTSDYISLINVPIAGTGDWTITFWYKSTTQAVQHILAFGDENNFRDCIQIFIGSDNKLHFDLEAVSGPKTINTVTDVSWHFGTVIVKAGNGYIYDNSNVSDSINGMNPNITNAVSKFIGKGRLAIGNAASFNGNIDDIGIWNRALTHQEISKLYSNEICNSANISSGLVAAFPFAGNANDASGNANNGTVTGASLSADRFGNINNAYSFDGTSNFIEVAHSTSLSFTDSFAVSLWLNAPDYSLGTAGPLFERTPIAKVSSTGDGFNFETVDNNGTCCGAQFYARNLPGYVTYEEPSPMPINSWVHLVGTYNDNTLSLYQNNILLGSSFASVSMASLVDNLFIGKEGSNGRFFKGEIDDIRIYNKGLSSCDVDSLFNMADPCIGFSASITPQSSTSFCQGGSVNLNANTGTNFTYQWFKNGNIISNATSAAYQAIQAGSYSVSVSNGSCNLSSSSIAVSINPNPSVTLDSIIGFVNINANPIGLNGLPGGGSYTGQGVTGSSFNPQIAGLGKATIKYNYTNGSGCIGSASRNTIVYDTTGVLCTTYDTLTTHVIINDTNFVTIIDTTHFVVYDTLTTYITIYDTVKVYEPVSVPTYGLVGWWPFSGNANDLSGNGNNGIVRGATLSTDRFGQPNSAYQFSGKDSNLVSYIIANHNNLPSGNSPRTVSLWLTHDTYPVSGGSGNDGHPILGYGSSLSNSAIEILYGHTNSNSDFIRFSGFNSDFDVPVTYNLQDWYNIVAVYDGINASIFINNVLIGTSAFPGWNTLLDSIVFGSQTPRSRFHNGKIDDILIYNRAFNPAGVDSLFHANICRQTITVTDTLLINFPLTAFNPIAFQHTIKVYPNPSKDRITIDCGNFFSLAGYTIKITNSLGQTMFTNPINQAQFDIDLTGWTGLGIYFVHIIDPQLNTVEIRKIVLN